MTKYVKFFCITFLLIFSFSGLPFSQTTETVLFGPEEFVRGTGKSVVETREFFVWGFEAPFTLYIKNGDENGDNRVSSAKIWLNDHLLFGPSDFSQQVTNLEAAVDLSESSILKVQIESQPGSKLAVWIEGVPVSTPLNLVLDTNSAKSETIDPHEGGFISTYSEDGTQYTLQIPEGAFTGDDEVAFTITPILDVEGFYPALNFMGGAMFEPDGYQFVKPVILTIRLPAEKPLDKPLGFFYSGIGEEFHLYPISSIEPATNSVTFKLTHFSSTILEDGRISDCVEQGQGSAENPEDLYILAVECALMDWQARLVLDPYAQVTAEEEALIQDIMEEWFDLAVLPSIYAATTLEELQAAFAGYWNWILNIQMLEMTSLDENDFADRIETAMLALETKIQDKYDSLDGPCSQEPDYCVKYNYYQELLDWIGWTDDLYSIYSLYINYPDWNAFCGRLMENYPEGITVSPNPVSFAVGTTFQLDVNVHNTLNPDIQITPTWTNTNPACVSILDANGLIEGLGLNHYIFLNKIY